MPHTLASDTAPAGSPPRPLVVDLDGTLVNTDLLFESFFALLGTNPIGCLKALAAIRQGKAALKAALASDSLVEVGTLPFNADVLELVRSRKQEGGEVYLASASDRRHVEELARHLGLFDGVFSSDGSTNLAGARKAEVLCAAFGEGGFDYVGNARADVEVWRRAGEVLLANASGRLSRSVRQWAPHARSVSETRPELRGYLKALRVHQWLKNLLVFAPPLAAHAFGEQLVQACFAFVSFSLCASSVYLLNDLLDLRSDRQHHTKRRRPFASGRLPLSHGVALFPALLAGAIGLGLFLPVKFLIVLLCYYALTLAYSLWLKRKMLVDVTTLACLYGVRLVAGGAAVGIGLSPWLGALSVFLFLCLALVKRCTELGDRLRSGGGDPSGRGYRLADLPALQGMAAASGYVAVLVIALYFNSPDVRVLYSFPNRLWLLCVVLLYWVSRMLLISHRGEMHDDPVVFAATDRISQALIVISGIVVAASV